MRCVACGQEHLLASGQRVEFRAECEGCAADLHTCRHCAHHDPGASNQCREPQAERVADRERANRCEHFAPGSGEHASVGDEREAARSALDALFRKD